MDAKNRKDSGLVIHMDLGLLVALLDHGVNSGNIYVEYDDTAMRYEVKYYGKYNVINIDYYDSLLADCIQNICKDYYSGDLITVIVGFDFITGKVAGTISEDTGKYDSENNYHYVVEHDINAIIKV